MRDTMRTELVNTLYDAERRHEMLFQELYGNFRKADRLDEFDEVSGIASLSLALNAIRRSIKSAAYERLSDLGSISEEDAREQGIHLPFTLRMKSESLGDVAIGHIDSQTTNTDILIRPAEGFVQGISEYTDNRFIQRNNSPVWLFHESKDGSVDIAKIEPITGTPEATFIYPKLDKLPSVTVSQNDSVEYDAELERDQKVGMSKVLGLAASNLFTDFIIHSAELVFRKPTQSKRS